MSSDEEEGKKEYKKSKKLFNYVFINKLLPELLSLRDLDGKL
jgi:hypothetical protein